MRVSVDFEPLSHAAIWPGSAEQAGDAERARSAVSSGSAELAHSAMPSGSAAEAASSQAASTEASPEASLPEGFAALMTYLEDRFGLGAAAFAEHRLWHRPGHPAIWVAAADCVPPALPQAEAVGLLVARLKGRILKPTSVFLQRFGHHVTRNRYRLDDARLFRWLAREPVPVTPVDDGDGFVAVSDWAGTVYGCGVLRGATLTCELPQSWTQAESQ